MSRKYAPAFVLIALAMGTAAAERLVHDPAWLHVYGPNLAVTFFELSLAAGAIEWYLDRLRAKEREPSERQAHAHAREILRQANELLGVVMSSYSRQTGEVRDGDPMML